MFPLCCFGVVDNLVECSGCIIHVRKHTSDIEHVMGCLTMFFDETLVVFEEVPFIVIMHVPVEVITAVMRIVKKLDWCMMQNERMFVYCYGFFDFLTTYGRGSR